MTEECPAKDRTKMTSIRGSRSRGRGRGGRDQGRRGRGGRCRGGRGRAGIGLGAGRTTMMGKRNKHSGKKMLHDSSEPSNSAPVATKRRYKKRKMLFTVRKQHLTRTLEMKSPAGTMLSTKQKGQGGAECEALGAEKVSTAEVNKDGISAAHAATSGDTLVVTQQLKQKYHWQIMKKLTGDETEESMLAANPFGEFFLFVCVRY